MLTKIMTLETNPLQKLSTEGGFSINGINVKKVTVGVKKGIEFHVNSGAMADPKADCWFAVELSYAWTRKDGPYDSDTIITDGSTYYLCRRNLGETKLKLTPMVRDLIEFAVQEFVRSL